MRYLLHILFWLLIWFWMTTVYLYDPVDFVPFLFFNLLRLPAIMAATYLVNYLVVARQLAVPVPHYGRAVAIFLAIFLGATLIDRLISGLDWIEPTLNGEPLQYEFINHLAIPKNAFLLLGILSIAATFEFFQASVKQQKQIFRLKEEKLESELAFLRSQVNPHFLFNAFNNLYSMAVREGTPDLAKGLSGMAGLMRYLTYESNVPMVPVQKEIHLIRSFIEIQRLRVADEDDVFIHLNVEGDFSTDTIAPVLLLPLVENAFKHGMEPEQPAWIGISIRKEGHHLALDVKNKKVALGAPRESGMGLRNLRKRLSLIYPQRHELKIIDEAEMFTAQLKISLSEKGT